MKVIKGKEENKAEYLLDSGISNKELVCSIKVASKDKRLEDMVDTK